MNLFLLVSSALLSTVWSMCLGPADVSPSDATIIGEKASYDTGDAITVTCNYKAADGQNSVVMTCQDGSPFGTWDVPAPTCVVCTVDEDCENGECSSNFCKCNDNYVINVSNATLCETIQCSLTIDHANIVPTQSKYAGGVEVTITCDEHYLVKKDDASEEDKTEQTTTCDGTTGTWDPMATDCVVCNSDDDCTDGTCVGGACSCDGSKNFQRDENDPSLCVEVSCEGFQCNNGDCVMRNGEQECNCQTGWTGAVCDSYERNMCAGDPCGNKGNCSQTGVESYTCTCNSGFTGDNCQFASAFRPGSKMLFSDVFVKVGLTFIGIQDPEHMLIAAAKVKTGPAAYSVVTVTTTKGAGTVLSLVISPDSNPATPTTHTYSLPEDAAAAVTLLLKRDNSGPLQLEVNGAVAIATTLDIVEISEFQVGSCAEEESLVCVGEFLGYANPFVGTVTDITLGNLMAEWNDLETMGGQMGATTCANVGDFCGSGSTCVEDSGQLACDCTEAWQTGTKCDRARYVSFNGYTSMYNVSIDKRLTGTKEHQLTFVLQTEDSEATILEFSAATGCSFQLNLKAEGGDQALYFDDHPVSSAALVNPITLTFDGSTVNYGGSGGSISQSCSLTGHTDITILFGGPSTRTGLAANNLQGCVGVAEFNTINILSPSAPVQENLFFEECLTNYLPPDPCDADPHPCNEQTCKQDLTDYSAECVCTNPPWIGENCARKLYCEDSFPSGCQLENSKCYEIEEKTKESCKALGLTDEVCTKVIGRDVWYFFCECNEGWKGDYCETEVEAVVDEGNDQTTIIVVVVIVAIVLIVVVIVLLVRRRKEQAGNGANDGRTYSPRAAEKDIELNPPSAKIDEVHNIYDDPDIIRNPNVESSLKPDNGSTREPSPSPPPPPPPPPAEDNGPIVNEAAIALDIMDAPTIDGGSVEI